MHAVVLYPTCVWMDMCEMRSCNSRIHLLVEGQNVPRLSLCACVWHKRLPRVQCVVCRHMSFDLRERRFCTLYYCVFGVTNDVRNAINVLCVCVVHPSKDICWDFGVGLIRYLFLLHNIHVDTALVNRTCVTHDGNQMVISGRTRKRCRTETKRFCNKSILVSRLWEYFKYFVPFFSENHLFKVI